MAFQMCEVNIVGALMTEQYKIEVKTGKNNNRYCSFNVGVTTAYHKETNTYDNIYFKVIAFGYDVDNITKANRGDTVVITGDLSEYEWQGVKHKQVTARKVIVIPRAKQEEKKEYKGTDTDNPYAPQNNLQRAFPDAKEVNDPWEDDNTIPF